MHKDLPKNTLCFAIFSFQSYSTNVKLALKAIRIVSRRIPRFWSGRRCGPSKLVIGIQKNGGLDELAPGGRRKAVAFLMGKVLLLARTEELNDRLACRWLGIPGHSLPPRPAKSRILESPAPLARAEGPGHRGVRIYPFRPIQRPFRGPVGKGGVRNPAGRWGVPLIHQHDLPTAEARHGPPGAASATPSSCV